MPGSQGSGAYTPQRSELPLSSKYRLSQPLERDSRAGGRRWHSPATSPNWQHSRTNSNGYNIDQEAEREQGEDYEVGIDFHGRVSDEWNSDASYQSTPRHPKMPPGTHRSVSGRVI